MQTQHLPASGASAVGGEPSVCASENGSSKTNNMDSRPLSKSLLDDGDKQGEVRS